MPQPTQPSPVLTNSEIIHMVKQRANFYTILAHLFSKEVDQATYASLLKTDWASVAAIPAMGAGAAKINHYLEQSAPDILTQLAADYAQTFLDGVTITGAYPYESVYTSKDRLLMQEARDLVLEIYRQEELAVIPQHAEPEDHIAFELELMRHYCKKSIAALETHEIALAIQILEKQFFFLENHLLNWTPKFFEDVTRIAQTDFYQGLALLTEAFLNLEKEAIPGLLEELQTPAS
jgi:anaerobic sulfite reductase subunit A